MRAREVSVLRRALTAGGTPLLSAVRLGRLLGTPRSPKRLATQKMGIITNRKRTCAWVKVQKNTGGVQPLADDQRHVHVHEA